MIGVLRVFLHAVTAMQENLFAALIFCQQIYTTAVCGYPDVAIAVFYCLVDVVRAKTVLVVGVMTVSEY
jgi:hypothetical protein